MIMKHIKIYINEKLHVTSKSFYTCHPKTKKELQKIIIKRINKEGNEWRISIYSFGNNEKYPFRVYHRSAVYSCRVVHLFFIGRQADNHRREC